MEIIETAESIAAFHCLKCNNPSACIAVIPNSSVGKDCRRFCRETKKLNFFRRLWSKYQLKVLTLHDDSAIMAPAIAIKSDGHETQMAEILASMRCAACRRRLSGRTCRSVGAA